VQALPGCDAGRGYSPGKPVRHVPLTLLTPADERIEQGLREPLLMWRPSSFCILLRIWYFERTS
jgi:hypothetical protein